MQFHMLFILSLSIHYIDCDEGDIYSRLKKQGSIVKDVIVDDVISTKKTPTIVACALQCSNIAACDLFHYNQSDFACYMSSTLKTASAPTPENIFIKEQAIIAIDDRCHKYSNENFQKLNFSCEDIMDDFGTESDGINTICPEGISLEVFCDQTTTSGGWIVVQRRIDGSENFARKWVDYKNGFGDRSNSFWIGNDILHKLTQSRPRKIRFDMRYHETWYYAEYENFVVDSEEDKYKVSFGEYKGTAGDAFQWHNGNKFSTMDEDNDDRLNENCSQTYDNGGWWFHSCLSVNPNGIYGQGFNGHGLAWYSLTEQDTFASVDYIEMKIK